MSSTDIFVYFEGRLFLLLIFSRIHDRDTTYIKLSLDPKMFLLSFDYPLVIFHVF